MRQLYDLLRYFMLLRHLMFCPMLSCTLIHIWFDIFLGLSFCFFFSSSGTEFPIPNSLLLSIDSHDLYLTVFPTLYVLLRSDIMLVFLLFVRVQFPIAFLLCPPLYMYQIIHTYKYIWFPYTNNECLWVQWFKYFHEMKDEMLNGTFHLSPNENICSIARMKKTFIIYFI